MRIVILANSAWYIYNFRMNLINSLKERGHEVICVSPQDEFVSLIQKAGLQHIVWDLKSSGLNPLKEIVSLCSLSQLLRKEKIDAVLAYTTKCNIYGAIASRLTKSLIINNISGLGYVFIKQGILKRFVILLYKISFKYSYKILFQNLDDKTLFLKENIVSESKVDRVPGSGVDLIRFSMEESGVSRDYSEIKASFSFLLVARMLWDKGVKEFVDAARAIKKKYPNAKFLLLGMKGIDNPAAISEKQILDWQNEGVVEYLGANIDVVPIMRKSDVVVLPSYREGMPRTMLEAASLGKPIITTDVPGCRDTVDHGVTGFLCKVKSSEDLETKMLTMLHLSDIERYDMGMNGRKKMEKEFDEKLVLDKYLELLESIEIPAISHYDVVQ